MSTFENQDVYTSVVLVDRAGMGGTEIIYDGVRLVFKPGQIKLAVPRFVADWLYGNQKHMVWTEDGNYTNRFAIEGLPEELLAQYGSAAGDTSPITIDGNRVEGWDTTQVDRTDGKTRVVQVRVPPNLLTERQGQDAYTFGARKEK